MARIWIGDGGTRDQGAELRWDMRISWRLISNGVEKAPDTVGTHPSFAGHPERVDFAVAQCFQLSELPVARGEA